jgi:hypothetical protein
VTGKDMKFVSKDLKHFISENNFHRVVGWFENKQHANEKHP